MSDDDLSRLRAIYNEASQGAGIPEVAIVGGDALNAALQTDEYEDDGMYLITPSGITLIGDE